MTAGMSGFHFCDEHTDSRLVYFLMIIVVSYCWLEVSNYFEVLHGYPSDFRAGARVPVTVCLEKLYSRLTL
jgi:hypothetical protein